MNKKSLFWLLAVGLVGLCQVQSLQASRGFHPEGFGDGAGHDETEAPREEGPRIDVDFIQKLHEQQQAGDGDRTTGLGLKSGPTVVVRPVVDQLLLESGLGVAGDTTGTVSMNVEDHEAIEKLATESAGDFSARVSAEAEAHEPGTEFVTPTEVAPHEIKRQLIQEFRQKLMTSEALKEILDNPGAFKELKGYKEINEKIHLFERDVLMSRDPEKLRQQMAEVIEDIRGSKLVLLEYRKQAEKAALREQKVKTKGFIFKKKPPLRKVTAEDLKALEDRDRSNSLKGKADELLKQQRDDYIAKSYVVPGRDFRVYRSTDGMNSHKALQEKTEDDHDALIKQNYNYEQRVNDITRAQRALQKLMENPKATSKQMAAYERKRDLLAKEKAEIAVKRGGLPTIYTYDSGPRPGQGDPTFDTFRSSDDPISPKSSKQVPQQVKKLGLNFTLEGSDPLGRDDEDAAFYARIGEEADRLRSALKGLSKGGKYADPKLVEEVNKQLQQAKVIRAKTFMTKKTKSEKISLLQESIKETLKAISDKIAADQKVGVPVARYQRPAEGNVPADSVIAKDTNHGWGLYKNRVDLSHNPKYEKVHQEVVKGLGKVFTYLNASERIRQGLKPIAWPPALLRSFSDINAELEKLAQPGLDPKDEAVIQKKISALIKKINSLPEVRNVREVQVQRPAIQVDAYGRPVVFGDARGKPVDSLGNPLVHTFDAGGNYRGLFHPQQ